MAGELRAIFTALKKDAENALRNIGQHFGKFGHDTANKAEEALKATKSTEHDLKGKWDGIKEPKQSTLDPKRSADGVKGIPSAGTHGPAGGAEAGYSRGIDRAFQKSRQTKDLDCKIDPIDLAVGRVILTQTDVELAGALPLVLGRTHLSSYRAGRSFGPSWASTFDQRLEVSATSIRYAADDGMLLTYPVPADGIAALADEGPRWPLRLREDGVYTITDPQRGVTFQFAPVSEPTVLTLRAISNRAGHRIELDYDQDGTLTDIRHSGGYRIAVETAGQRITALHLHGAESSAQITLIRYGYNSDGQLTDVINSSGTALKFTYDPDGKLTSWLDRNGVSYRYTYDETVRCVSTSGADGCMRGQLSYDMDARITVVTDSLGNKTTHHLNERGQVVREIDPMGRETVSLWDRYDQLLARTDPLGRTTRYAYDEFGNLISITRPDGIQALAEYNELRLPVTITDPCGVVWRRTYDKYGNLTTATDPLGAITVYAYDGQANLSSVTDALGYVSQIESNTAGLPVAVTDPHGATTSYARDIFGRVSALTDPVGGVTRFDWTTEGKLAERILPDGATERWTYDGEGNLVEYVDTLGQVTRTEFGPFDLPVAEVGPDGARIEFRYDTELRLVDVTNPQGMVWHYDYDSAGNLIRETDFNGRQLSYTYDAAGQLIERTNGIGQLVRFVRDAVGNLTEQHSNDTIATFEYDSAGRIVCATNPDADVSFDRDSLGRILTETCNGRTVTSIYDALGRRTYRRTPSGAESTWEYGAVESPIALHTAGQTLRFDYDAAGREVQRRLGASAVLAQVWDANHRLASQTVTASGSGLGMPISTLESRLVQSRSYSYRPDGYITNIDDRLSGLRRFDLDPAGRVTAARGHGWSERYAYDSAGNIANAAWPAPAQDSSIDAAGQGERQYAGTLIRSAGNVRYRHDPQGRVTLRQQKRLTAKPRTWHYTWNTYDRLIAVTTPDRQRWRYHYDPLGRRIAKQRLEADGVTVAEQLDFTWDGVVLAEQTHTGDRENVANTTTWDWEPDTFRPVSQTERTLLRNAPQKWIDQQFYAIVTDLVGTPTELLSSDGILAWHPRTTLWGTAVDRNVGNADCPLRFPGQYYDPETGLNYNYHRYYDPITARYESGDPLGITPEPNPHTYVRNPTVWIDPFGLAPTCGVNSGSRGLGALSKAGDYGVWPYRTLRADIKGTGLDAHHLIEQRLAGVMGQRVGEMASIAVTETEHRVFFTNAWRKAIPYGPEGTGMATRSQVESAARQIYANYPDILKALGL